MLGIDIPIEVLIGLLGVQALAVYYFFKRKLHDFRVLVDAVDDGLADGTLTDEEADAVYEAVKKLLAREEAPAA